MKLSLSCLIAGSALLASCLGSPAAQAFQSLQAPVNVLRWDQLTLLSGFLKPSTDKPDTVPVSVLPGKTLDLPVWRSPTRSKGLWILIPGTGANAKDNMGGYVSERANAGGFDTIVVPNPFSTSFQESVSADGIIGIPHRDIDDLVNVINAAYSSYSAQYGRPARVNVLGISLGATYALMLEAHERALKFGVSRYVVVNPPVQFQYAMDQLDSMIQDNYREGEIKALERQISYLLPIFLQTYKAAGAVDTRSAADLQALTRGDQNLHRQIIGSIFQLNLRDIAKHLTDLPGLLDPVGKRRLEDELRSITFAWYEGYISLHVENDPRIKGKTVAELAHDVDLSVVLAQAPRLADTYVIGTKDDFLLAPQDLAFLNTQFGDHLFVFSTGGHCGEIWFKNFQALLVRLAQ